ncbi:MAG TPA: DUF262 domain-containing protein [Candidatus Ornithomonoglobus intestinigallinarum]|uniref:DUF262 domain-containing protein n=1 Tax=Candidatus Ornithomonoglobus intestinigallinarum TaxID=2840894 RepID=A0A9D1H2H3_9FIRM|nr:DUF262 domain-containing protein [Candidatus Ornithomonoglobus intestinigallinarum]
MSNSIPELHIIDENDNNIFDTDTEYIIPLYQRAYAWEDKQLTQLVEDIKDVSEAANYYMGSLIVSKQNGRYEVVDGQQRLTSLYLLLNCLGIKTKPTLTFACREKSNYTLRNIEEIILDNRSKLDTDRIEPSIQRGIKILSQELGRDDFDKEAFIKKLAKVVICRIEVPEKTDLNRYFEIMNTRGEQLEQHDILKAELMGYLNDAADKSLFAKIWDACSDMTGYVQMHFTGKNNTLRELIFGPGRNDMPPGSWQEYKKAINGAAEETTGKRICDLIAENFEIEDDEGYVKGDEGDVRVRFESVIEFPYFLLHTLKVYVALNGIRHEHAGAKITDELSDDKKLPDAFKRVLLHGVSDSGKAADDKENFARTFIVCLLRTRFLFDKYIIKREYANDSSEGEWSLKSLYVSGKRSEKKAYYSNTKFTKDGRWDKTNDWLTKKNIMMQSALRVSYTSPKAMHWITKLLIWLSENGCERISNGDLERYNEVSEGIAVDAVKENFFNACDKDSYAMGVNTPHIVFNYLDYLLWKQAPEKYSDFVFEFRNSVEHWYPQNPSDFESWKDGVDRFGNLCIIQRNVNARFSNISPEAKSKFEDIIAKGSIKLRIMSELTEKNGEKAARLYWKETACRVHEEEMIGCLKAACRQYDAETGSEMMT